ncbi:alpha/beta hydrolase [Pseudoxanthomonas sp. JBR18]|uniref:alpha/beta fold hydrolase n=1 Tax=Pseudoxanthomonas sp. JBR18 TaxID=2969308 RepID=UPI002306CC74|nr:alpha/beta hydrolase [Pseudoxanthomonas sp. JBR18]WCE02746.1 alpha/beta hydrolase [Pseudoxanthomonas sp. JBR18]
MSLFEGFTARQVNVGEVTLQARIGGSGPPLLLLHGHPQTHAMWHHVAPALARHYTVVLADLRGYGDSSKPEGDADGTAYTKRLMAADMVQLMQHFGFARFRLAAHDRGARVAHRLALDHPDQVQAMVLLDIAPTLDMYSQASERFARAYWHWFFLIQPAPLPERLIQADPAAYVREVMGRRHAGLSVFAPEALAEYERCAALPGTATGICGDYRASAGLDLALDRQDRAEGRQLTMPLHVLWGAHGAVHRCFDVLTLWRNVAGCVSGRPLDCGHYLAEERPTEVTAAILDFFAGHRAQH